ncbi:MAG: hypothetical protein EOM70_09050 [Clostridia bacterium]|nr:hypothetical protein [Clostridia bacterium]
MKKSIHTSKKILVLMAIIALMVMMIPVAVMAKAGQDKFGESGPGNSYLAHQNKGSDDEEEETIELEDPEEKSVRAIFIAERNQWAMDHAIPPGHVNLIDKYLALRDDEDAKRDDVVDDYFEDGKLNVKILMLEIKALRNSK